ncbi:hypothetical protein [Pseudomonas sp. 2023EL-01195]|uniref:hypothetical protein n=1 Tax=Pseudomonas sp. 2023EL-01195 TaxID=3088134 RepID=UPI00296AEEE9|nr:hypothetical protein [Pseudomonas sp. 2023EL-01195]MDW3711852.1 hypothetical protein [Pseudomonas sp. 2023EL-01195]
MVYQRTNAWMLALGLPLLLAGCASHSCDEPMSGEQCREERLLYQNDMLQAKMLVASGEPDNFELASALLSRAEAQDQRGEVPFYQAVLKIHEGPQVEEVLSLLERAAAKHHPHATALLYKIYAEPFLISEADPLKAELYRADYANLDVAKSGYPSFEKALAVVNALVTPPPPPPVPAPEQ